MRCGLAAFGFNMIDGNAHMITTDNISRLETDKGAEREARRSRLARLASAAFFVGAIALVNPALATECDDTAELVRIAAADDTLESDKIHTIERALEMALDHQARGDDDASRMEFTLVRKMLARA